MQAIFSDDSDDEGDDSSTIKVGNQEKKAEVANTALSRLIAGDFLESLGKELGLEVPPDTPYLAQKSGKAAPQKENVNEYAKTDILNGENNNRYMPESSSIKTKGTCISDSKLIKSYGDKCEDDKKIKPPLVSRQDSSSRSDEERSRKHSGKLDRKKYEDDKKVKMPSANRQDYRSSSSSEEERSRKRSRHRRRRDAGSDSSSDDERDQHSSRSKGRRRERSSRDKSSGSKKHSKHHKHRKHESPSRSPYSTGKDDAYSKKERRRRE